MSATPAASSMEVLSSDSLPVLPIRNYQIHVKSWTSFFMELFIMAVPLGVAYWFYKKIRKDFDDRQDEKQEEQTQSLLKEKFSLKDKNGQVIGPIRHFPKLNDYELKLSNDIIFPEQMTVTFNDIGGMEKLKNEIFETVILPLQSPHLFYGNKGKEEKKNNEEPMEEDMETVESSAAANTADDLLSPPRGVLFYGPPGCGKTMMAKALAKQCKATFLNIRFSSLQNKWYGESQKLTRAIFSLANKLAPTIIFIDEIDLFLRKRNFSDHEVTASMKGEFMSLWDGIISNRGGEILVLGCTNRPFDLDEAVLRRMPRQFLFDLPIVSERISILKVLLRAKSLSSDVDLEAIAKRTEDYSGSDLKELCRYAAMQPIRELIKKKTQKGNYLQGNKKEEEKKEDTEQKVEDDDSKTDPNNDNKNNNSIINDRNDNVNESSLNPEETIGISEDPRPLQMQDFEDALAVVEPSGKASYEYQQSFRKASRTSARAGKKTNKFGLRDRSEGKDGEEGEELSFPFSSSPNAARDNNVIMPNLFGEGILGSIYSNAHLWPQFIQFLQERQGRQQGRGSNTNTNSNTNNTTSNGNGDNDNSHNNSSNVNENPWTADSSASASSSTGSSSSS